MAEGKTIGSLLIKIAADTAMLRAGIKSSQKDIKAFEKNLGTLKNAFIGLFSVGVITNFAKQSFQAYQQQLKQEKLLLTALKGRTDVQERLIRQANYLQSTTLFEDDQIIEQQKMLAALGMSERQIRDIIKAATQLATALGTDLGTAVKNLTGTYAGNLRELGKYIPELKNFTKEQLAAGAAVEWVNKNMKGLAETAANIDPITQMTKAWGEMKEQFGEFISPAVTKFATRGTKQFAVWGSDQLNFWQKASTLFGDKRLNKFYEVIQATNAEQQAQDDLAASTEKTTAAVVKQTKAIENLSEAQMKQSLASMAQSGKTFVGIKGAGETELQKYSMDYLPKSIEAPKIEGVDTMKATLNDMQDAFRTASNNIKNNVIDISNEVKNMVSSMVVDLASGIGEMAASGEGLNFNFIPKAIASAAKQFGAVLISLGTAALAAKSISLPGGGVGAIVAGTALVAIASAAEAALSSVSNMKAPSSSLSSVNHSAASGSGSDYYSRMYGEGYRNMKIEVFGTLNNGLIHISSERGKKQLDRW